MDRPDRMILTAGPSITKLEEGYVLDAVRHGWNWHWSDYLERFEKKLAEYLGVKHVLPVSHGTGALHLAMLALNIGPGDEVIIPDTTYIACANVVKYVGATPVFADVDRATWCLDPDSVERNITRRTRAILPVWMYGNAPDMDGIMEIAQRHGLFVVEDSCPALGTIYKGKKAGAIGDIGVFSFQGAKIAVMGEGGAFITNSDEFYERAQLLCKGGMDPSRQFWVKDVGYMYKLSNLQAALALAQIERIEELVARKRQIFGWYQEQLSGISAISINREPHGVRSNMWMSSVVLAEDVPASRDWFRTELKNRLIDTRPFFFPITMFPIYSNPRASGLNPNSYFVGLQGVNLPSGVERTKEEIDYIGRQIRELLKA
ncbi:MAG: DegT/DnrJ/EryC1/StrS family aminotransferase [Parcubacteria group bacterium]|nr:DegT/DnrJ/EryC1/StrS family aminotransferase [Parcubacteria group bacterium]